MSLHRMRLIGVRHELPKSWRCARICPQLSCFSSRYTPGATPQKARWTALHCSIMVASATTFLD